jgi:hypothetical protein
MCAIDAVSCAVIVRGDRARVVERGVGRVPLVEQVVQAW